MQTDNFLTVRRLIPAPREDVFDVWLDPESAVWIPPPESGFSTTAKLDPRVGGRLEVIVRGPDRVYPHTGEYRVLDRPSRLVFTWISEATEHRESVVTVEFHARGEETEVVLTHAGLASAQAAQEHTGGWTELLDNLASVSRPNR